MTMTEPRGIMREHPQEEEMIKVTNLLNLTGNFSKQTSRFVELNSDSSSSSKGSEFGSMVQIPLSHNVSEVAAQKSSPDVISPKLEDTIENSD